MRKPTSIVNVVVSLCMVVASGCSVNPTEHQLPSGDTIFSSAIASARAQGDSEQLVALDLVSALVQISEMNPARVVLEMNELSSSFDMHVQSALNSAGYRQQTEDPTLQSLLVVTAVNPTGGLTPVASATSVKTYQIKIRNIILRRDYLIENGRIEPRSWMHIEGAYAIRVKLDDSIFDTPILHYAKAEQHSTTHPLPTDDTLLNTSMRPDLPQADASVLTPHAWSDLNSLLPLVVRAEPQVGPSLSGGDPIRITVEVDQDSWIHCYYEDSIGTVARVFPNRYQKDSMVLAGETLVLPKSSRWQLSAPLAGETEHVMCLAIAPEGNETKPLLPDLLPIVASDLGDIQKRYEDAAGTEVVSRKVSIAVN